MTPQEEEKAYLIREVMYLNNEVRAQKRMIDQLIKESGDIAQRSFKEGTQCPDPAVLRKMGFFRPRKSFLHRLLNH